MKRVIAAAIIFSVAVIFSVWSSNIFKRDMQNLSEALNNVLVSTNSGNESLIKEKINYTEELWNKYSGVFHMLVIHEGMDDVEQSITALPDAFNHGGKDILAEKCIDAIAQIESLMQAEKINIQNIF